MVDLGSDTLLAALVGALVGGVAAFAGAYLALRHRAHSAERARMATEIMYHVMTAVVLLEEALVALEEVLLARDQGRSKKELRDLAESLRKDLQKAFAGYDPLRPHVDYRVGKLMRLPPKAMAMLDELERRLAEAFTLWEGGRLLLKAAQGKDEDISAFDQLSGSSRRRTSSSDMAARRSSAPSTTSLICAATSFTFVSPSWPSGRTARKKAQRLCQPELMRLLHGDFFFLIHRRRGHACHYNDQYNRYMFHLRPHFSFVCLTIRF